MDECDCVCCHPSRRADLLGHRPWTFKNFRMRDTLRLNFGLASDYQGRCNLRFDDTNPEKESEEYARAIQEDVRWLGFQWNGEVRWASDYFEQLYGYAVDLNKKGVAYVDDLGA